MKLYVWNDPYPVSYGSSYAFAVAENEDAARAMILAEAVKGVNCYGEYLTPRPNFIELNEPPTRVAELPCSEIIEWSE